jgi:hypothetical protein
MLIQIDLSNDINKKLNLLKIQLDHLTKAETINYILKEYFEKKNEHTN